MTVVPIVLPVTTGGSFALTGSFAVTLMGAGTTTTGIVSGDQPRALDLAARGARRLERLPDAIIAEVMARGTPRPDLCLIAAEPQTLKYRAWGWWTTMALVLCSGCSCHSSLSSTPMRPEPSSSSIGSWSLRFGQAG